MEHNNLAAILACILLQDFDDIENMIMALFIAVSPEFSRIDYMELLKAEQPLTAAELLKAAGEEDESKRQKASHTSRLKIYSDPTHRLIKRFDSLQVFRMGDKDLLEVQHARLI